MSKTAKRTASARSTVRKHAMTLGGRIVAAVNRFRLDLPALALDSILISAAYLAILILRFDGTVPTDYWSAFLVYLPLALTVHLGCNLGWGLYRRIWEHAGVREAREIIAAGATTLALLVPVYLLAGRPVPVSVALLGALAAIVLSAFVRFQSRLFATRRNTGREAGLRAMVVGAGDSAAAVIREMHRDRLLGMTPVAVLDDDPRKHGMSLVGVPVVGSVEDLEEVATELRVHRVILAIPGADRRMVEGVVSAAERAEIPLKVAPQLGEMFDKQSPLRDIRDLNIEDVLGRQQVSTDLQAMRGLLEGKTVLITGAGGSIGSEIARQVAKCDPGELVLLDNDETHLHDIAAELTLDARLELCDVKNSSRTRKVFGRRHPHVVFHAAAHKHVPLLEEHPCEAVFTNVAGTANVVEASRAVGVETFVLVSTDKAVAPTSVMGATKWLAEQIVLAVPPDEGRYCAVRFGNVLGSRGSVIPTFARQIAAGGPVTVTDARMTRYFMSISESVQLVLQAASFAHGSDVYMLEMGEPANILDLAHRMIRLAGYRVGDEIQVEIIGTRPGEKLAEQLRSQEEPLETTAHEAIMRLRPTSIGSEHVALVVRHLLDAARCSDDDEVVSVLLEVANGADPAAVCSETLVLDDGDAPGPVPLTISDANGIPEGEGPGHETSGSGITIVLPEGELHSRGPTTHGQGRRDRSGRERDRSA